MRDSEYRGSIPGLELTSCENFAQTLSNEYRLSLRSEKKDYIRYPYRNELKSKSLGDTSDDAGRLRLMSVQLMLVHAHVARVARRFVAQLLFCFCVSILR